MSFHFCIFKFITSTTEGALLFYTTHIVSPQFSLERTFSSWVNAFGASSEPLPQGKTSQDKAQISQVWIQIWWTAFDLPFAGTVLPHRLLCKCFQIFLIFRCMGVMFACCMYVHHVCVWWLQGQKNILGPLELELQMVMLGIEPKSPLQK